MNLVNTFKVLMLLIIGCLTCSCSYDANNRIMTNMDKVAERIGVKKQDPGKRLVSVHRAVYDFYKNYELVYFYRDNDPRSKAFEKTIRQYAQNSWVKITTCSIDKKQLPYTRESVYSDRDIRYKYFVVRYERDQIKAPALFLLLEADGEIDVYPIAVQEKVPCTGCHAQDVLDKLSVTSTGTISYEELVGRINWIAGENWPILQRGDTSHI
jgi:hypothetical protein